MRRENADAYSVSSSRMRGPSIPETPVIEPRSRGVLGPPLSRRTTAVDGALSLQQIAARGTCRGAVLAERLDDVLADLPLVYFVGTVDQPLRAHLRVPFGERGILAEAERAVELDRGVDHLVHHVRVVDLGDRVLLADVEAFLCLVGDVQQHQAADIELL